jgi:hypothetical protein
MQNETIFIAVGRNNVKGPRCSSPRKAAQAFFRRYPLRKICTIGEYDVGRGGALQYKPGVHRTWREISPDQVDTLLPDLPSEIAA